MTASDSSSTTQDNADYKVVALRYRPQSFEDLVGQGSIATALSNAIKQSRVGHAYLFTGARGVGKTSSARIFAKCLNCRQGPTTTPCNECDICEAVSAGEDIDVLEIDGASNRGIDEIRQLRSNAAIRPSTGRFKIYIIDEVHMLTQQAFNALLKTLEEPPGHVKFIFCTTDPQKIPITVLSRCQRFDFSPVQSNEISDRLREIATAEGVTADEQALALLARRANGSMRDSQSLLEQLFSFCGEKITVEEVHQLLGTSDIGKIAEIATAMANKDSSAALTLIHQSISDGSDAGQTAEQLLGYFRDMMAVRVGGGEDLLLNCSATDMDLLQQLADQLGLETILSCVQVMDDAVVRMQSSLHARTLLEVAAIRICNLENLDSIGDLVNALSAAGGASGKPGRPRPSGVKKSPVKLTEVSSPQPKPVKKNEIAETTVAKTNVSTATPSDQSDRSPAATTSTASATAAVSTAAAAIATVEKTSAPATTAANASAVMSSSELEQVWQTALSDLGGMVADMAGQYELLECRSAEHMVITMEEIYATEQCSRPERKQKLELALSSAAGRTMRIDFVASTRAKQEQLAPEPKMSRAQQMRKLQENSYIKNIIDMFDAEVLNFYQPKRK